MKNGYTVKAGGSFVGAATRGGRSYVVTVLRADGRTSEMARQLLDWAFAAAPAAQPVGRLVSPEDVAAGRLGDGGTPGATLTPGATPTAPGMVTPTLGQVTTPPPAPSSTALPTLGTDSGTAGATADAWAAGVVLGAVAAFSLVSAVLVLRRSRLRQAEGDTIVPGLLLRRLGGRGKPDPDGTAGKDAGADATAAKGADGEGAEPKDGAVGGAVAREPAIEPGGSGASPTRAFPDSKDSDSPIPAPRTTDPARFILIRTCVRLLGSISDRVGSWSRGSAGSRLTMVVPSSTSRFCRWIRWVV